MSLTKVTNSMIQGAYVNVLDYGAVGNGTDNDTPAFDLAIAALPTGGGTVYIPAGYTFAVNLVIVKSGVRLLGGGVASSQAAPTGNYLKPFDPLLPCIKIGNDTVYVSGVTIENVHLNGNAVGTIGLFFSGGAYRCNWVNVHIQRFITNCVKYQGGATYACAFIKGVNISLSGSTGCDVVFVDGAVGTYTTANWITNFDKGSPATSGYALVVDSTFISLIGGWIQASDQQGIHIKSTTAVGYIRCSDVVVDSDNSADILLEVDDTTTLATNYVRGSITIDGKWKNGTPLTMDLGVSSYSYNLPMITNPVVTGSITFPDQSASGFTSDTTASISGGSTAGARTLILKGNTIQFNPQGLGVVAAFYTTNFQPWNDYGIDLGGASKRWGTTYTKTVKLSPLTVATLPTAASLGAGHKAFVTDATVTTFASIVAGGGANGVPVYSDGTNWRIG